MDWTVFGLEIAPIVRALVDVLKSLGVKGKWSLIAAMVVAGALVAVKEIAAMYPGFAPWFELGVHVLSAALWASTLHDGIQAVNGRSR